MHLKIQTTKLTYFLQTSNKNYTSKQVKDYKEISCGKESDYNNWEIVKLNEERQQFLKSNQHKIFDSDKIIIRNYKTGYSLHSHKKQYASTGMQEVTCFSYERDVNDWWVIQQTYQMASKQIQDQMPINLVHQETIKFLSVDEYNLAKSKNGNQVRATQASMQQSFIISTIDNQSLIIGKPFFLFYQPLNKYLCQGPSISEMQQTQYEAIMVDKITNSCLWVIEKLNEYKILIQIDDKLKIAHSEI